MRRAVALALAAAAPIAACFPQNQCAFTWKEYCAQGDPSCQGHLIDANTWESGPIDGDWLDYAHNTNWFMHFRDGVTGQQLEGDLVAVQAWISPVARPNDPGNQFSQAAGNLAEFHVYTDGSGWAADVHNDSCADYFLYVRATSTPSPDASTE
jgi:hypothetical protein